MYHRRYRHPARPPHTATRADASPHSSPASCWYCSAWCPTDPNTHLFTGTVCADAAQKYLTSSHCNTLKHLSGGRESTVAHPGATPLATPMSAMRDRLEPVELGPKLRLLLIREALERPPQRCGHPHAK